MEKTTMENGIHYTLVVDYYFPTCTLDSKPVSGKWAAMYERYLSEEHPHEYTRLIWTNELAGLLQSVQWECEERLEVLVRQMAEAEGVNAALKASDQMSWVGAMNNIRSRAEEIVIHEMML